MTKSNPGESTPTSNSAEGATSLEDTVLNDAALDGKVLDTIGQALKAHYDDLVQAPLPQKFLDLLADLEKQEKKQPEDGRDA